MQKSNVHASKVFIFKAVDQLSKEAPEGGFHLAADPNIGGLRLSAREARELDPICVRYLDWAAIRRAQENSPCTPVKARRWRFRGHDGTSLRSKASFTPLGISYIAYIGETTLATQAGNAMARGNLRNFEMIFRKGCWTMWWS